MLFKSKKIVVILVTGIILVAIAKDTKEEVLVCVRWTWTGDVFNRKVYCIQWEKKDCSNRLHKEICKLEGVKP